MHTEAILQIPLGDEAEHPGLADTFADWLYGECFAQNAYSLILPSPKEVEKAPTASLLATALIAAANGRHALAAHMLRELGNRFEARQ